MQDDYYDFILWTGSILTFLLQLYVVYLISFKCTQEMKEYAYFLKLLTVSVVVSDQPATIPINTLDI